MALIPSFGEITQKAIHTFKRYPITLIWAILGSLFTIWLIDADIPSDEQTAYTKISLVASMGISWLISARFLVNYFKEVKHKNKNWLMVIPVLFLLLFYWYLPNSERVFDDTIYVYKIFLYFLIGHLLLLFSPFLFAWNKIAYWNYLKTVFIAITRSVLFSGVLYLGLNLALLALKFLFDIDFEDLLFAKLFVFCSGIVNTWIYLSDFPERIHDNVQIDYPKALEVFVKYILIPLTVLYIVILYAYSIKILINWSLPKGWVSYLVIALSFLGVLIHVLINPVRKTINSRAIKLFYPWFYVLLLPMIGLLFVAILKRLSEYGFTENRYIVFVLACWIMGVTLYILFSKKKQLRYVTMSLATMLLLISFGFWGMFLVSEKSQLNQFSELFKEMKSTEFKISSAQNKQFKSIVKYLTKHNVLNQTENTLGFNPETTFKDESSWNISNKIIDTLGVIVIKDPNDKVINKFPNYRFVNYNNDLTFDVVDYDYFKRLHFSRNRINDDIKTKFINDNEFCINYDHSFFEIKMNNNDFYQIDLKPLMKELVNGNYKNKIPNSLVFIEKEYLGLRIKLFVTKINLKTKKDNTLGIRQFGVTVFVSEKSE